MWSWRKKEIADQPLRAPAAVALTSSSTETLVREAVRTLGAVTRADRAGIWLEENLPSLADADQTLRGVLWDRNDELTPAAWEKLSFSSGVPTELLNPGRSVEQQLHSSDAPPIFGPLLGLHHVLWSPVRSPNRLRGVLLTGWQKPQAVLPRAAAESIAAQLALSLEFAEQQRLAEDRQADLRLHQHIADSLASGTAPESILLELAESCTALFSKESRAPDGFAVVGHLSSDGPVPLAQEIDLVWSSGDSTWTRNVNREPLSPLWRRALEIGGVFGTEAPASWIGLARLVAIPLTKGSQTRGVLLAGIPRSSSSLHILERLQMRASLAAAALECRAFNEGRLRRAARQHALLEASPEAIILLDARGLVAGVNRTGRLLLEETSASPAQSGSAKRNASGAPGDSWYIGAPLAQLFCAREQARVEEWSRRARTDNLVAIRSASPCEAELLTGVRVRLHAPIAAPDDLMAVLLDPAPSQGAVPQRVSEVELQHVLEWVEEGVVLFDNDQGVRAMNTRFAQIAGLSAEETARCASLEDVIAYLAPRATEPAAFTTHWRELAAAAEGGAREEVHFSRPVPRVLERSARPVLDKSGRRCGRLEIYRDLTAQRVFQAKLLQTEKLAALGQLVTGVAHELSNPLTSILGYSQRLLVRNDLAGSTVEALQIHQEAERATGILRQLLLTARDTRPERQRVALNQILQKAMELQRFGSASEKIRIELDLDPALPFIIGDSGQLQQVAMNLIGNARQAIVQEGRPGTIRLRTARNGDHRVQIQVADDGPGIPQAILARIFDPFFTTKPAGVGTGLGLAIVLSVVREHGGNVHVANLPTGGAAFTVDLPSAARSGADGAARASFASAVQMPAGSDASPFRSRPFLAETPAPKSKPSQVRVLVVEDEPTVARLIADVLEDEGIQVDVLLDGRAALERAAHQLYDLVICDMKMPGIDGQRFYRSLVQTQNPLRDHFLFVTGDVLAPQTQEFLERNHIPHVAKPFRVEELTDILHRLLGSPSTHAESAAAGRKAN